MKAIDVLLTDESGERGFTLVEVLAALAIFAMVVTFAYGALGTSYGAVFRSEVSGQAARIAGSIVEDIRSQVNEDWDKWGVIDEIDENELDSTFVSDRLSLDYDDYNLHRDYTLTVDVGSEDFFDPDGNDDDDWARVLTVILEWEEDGQDREYSVRTIVANN